MDKRAVGTVGVLFSLTIPLIAACGCGEKATEPAAISVQSTPPANLPPAALQRRMAEEQGRAADAKYAASTAGAKYRQ